MALSTTGIESYNQQVAAIQSQLNRLQQPSFTQMASASVFQPPHKVLPVDGIEKEKEVRILQSMYRE